MENYFIIHGSFGSPFGNGFSWLQDFIASEEKQDTFMNPTEVANTIMNNIFNINNLTVADSIIERN